MLETRGTVIIFPTHPPLNSRPFRPVDGVEGESDGGGWGGGADFMNIEHLGRAIFFLSFRPGPFVTCHIVGRVNKITDNKAMLLDEKTMDLQVIRLSVKLELLKGAGLLYFRL